LKENPYGRFVLGDVLECLSRTPDRIEALTRNWADTQFERTYAPGKWTARQILIHLAQAELVFSTRLRFALAQPDYVVQPFDQDPWLDVDGKAAPADALAAYLGVRRLNVPLWRSLTPPQRAHRFRHPEQGEIDVEWLLTLIAGHELNHLPQLESIAAS
jgi:hypothetical protein